MQNQTWCAQGESEQAQSKVGKAAACMRALRKMVFFSSCSVFTKNYTKYYKNRSLNVVFLIINHLVIEAYTYVLLG